MSIQHRNNYFPLHFHDVHGENIKLERNKTVAFRTKGYCGGIVFSNQPVAVDEPVFVKVLEIVSSYCGALRIGFTMNNPATLKSNLPRYACPDLTQKHGNWAKAIGENSTKKSSILCYYVDESGDVHYRIDSKEFRIIFGGVNTSSKLWAVLDIYGSTVAVEILGTLLVINETKVNDNELNKAKEINVAELNEEMGISATDLNKEKEINAKELNMNEQKERNAKELDKELENIELQNWKGLVKLSVDLESAFLNEADSDVILKVGDQCYPAHRVIIKNRSPVFRATLEHDMKEKNEGTIEIPDCDPNVFRDFLLYLYSGKLDNIQKENVFELYYMSEKYDVNQLKLECVDYLVNNLSIDIICEIIALSVRHDEKDLLKLATQFFVKHANDIFVTVQWQLFLKDNPVEANELIIKAFKNLSKN